MGFRSEADWKVALKIRDLVDKTKEAKMLKKKLLRDWKIMVGITVTPNHGKK
jgi:hypothetical protein